MTNYVLFRTENSTYELNRDTKCIRRLHGSAKPTERQGPDGVWKSFEEVSHVEVGERVLIVWEFPRATVTGPVVEILSQEMVSA